MRHQCQGPRNYDGFDIDKLDKHLLWLLSYRISLNLSEHSMAQLQSSTASSPPQQSNFPQDPADFDADSRISFDKLNQKFILETEDDKGEPLEFEYNDAIKRWIPVVCLHPSSCVDGICLPALLQSSVVDGF